MCLPALLICLGLHTLLDFTAVVSLLPGFSQTAAYAIIFTVLTIVAAVSVFFIRKLIRCWPETEVSHAETL